MTSISAIASLLDSTTMPNNTDRKLSWSAQVMSSSTNSIELRGRPMSDPRGVWHLVLEECKRSEFHVARLWLTASTVNPGVTLVMIEAYSPSQSGLLDREVYDVAAYPRKDITAQDVVDIILDYTSSI